MSKNLINFSLKLFRLRHEWRILLRPILNQHKITVEEWLILNSLEQSADGYLTMSNLADQQGSFISNVSRHADNLVKRGLASRRRNPKSDREVLVSISKSGRKLLDDILVDLQTHQPRLRKEAANPRWRDIPEYMKK